MFENVTYIYVYIYIHIFMHEELTYIYNNVVDKRRLVATNYIQCINDDEMHSTAIIVYIHLLSINII